MTVRELMVPAPATIQPGAPLSAALALMRERGARHLPVVDEEERLVGILTDRDLRSATLGRVRALAEASRDLRVEDVMTCGVVTTRPDATVAQAAAIMCERRLGCLPVVADGRLVGILTERDLVRAVARGSVEPGRLDPEDLCW